MPFFNFFSVSRLPTNWKVYGKPKKAYKHNQTDPKQYPIQNQYLQHFDYQVITDFQRLIPFLTS